MERINERIMQVIKHYELNKNSFAKKIGVSSNSVIENIVAGRQSKPSYDVLSKIAVAFNDVHLRWLLNGEGEMLISKEYGRELSTESKQLKVNTENSEHDNEIISLQKARIDSLERLTESLEKHIQLSDHIQLLKEKVKENN